MVSHTDKAIFKETLMKTVSFKNQNIKYDRGLFILHTYKQYLIQI